MRALHLTFRFGRDVIGGAEHYLHMLSRALIRRGVDVDVWTTKTAGLAPIARFGVRWDNALPARERLDGLGVSRYSTVNAPRGFVALADRLLRARWRREERAVAPALVTAREAGWLGLGWHALETHGPCTMRWSEGRAEVVIRDRAISEVFFEALCPRGLRGRFEANGRLIGTFETSATWTRHRFEARGDDMVTGRIVLERTWREPPDPRRLGIAVRDLGYVADGRRKTIPLADDHAQLLRRARGDWIAHLRARALARPGVYEALFWLLRAPLSPAMLWNLERKITRYDVVLAQMTPFSTLNYAVYFGRRHGVPVVLLPHFHTDDDFYHLRHYYRAFRRATAVLAFSDLQRSFFDGLGARSVVVGGGGVDPDEFRAAGGSGERFRDRFGLGTAPLIVYVGRKSPSKRYDLLIEAADFLNEHVRCTLVMIGPDEDGRPITSPNVRYLGRQPRALVLEALEAADVFATMSESESFGMVLLEAWMAKKPVIGNRACRAVADLIADGEDGFLCDDGLECAERMAELLLDRRLARRFGERGHDKVMREYTWDAIAAKVAATYATAST